MENSKVQTNEQDQLRVIGHEVLDISGEYGKMITFFNQTLKDKGLIFGLSKSGDKFAITIYEVP
ncbi:MAG: DUF4264 family protein [Firmicutes bacterium]|nr:DUF4264 family protein [Bacillota bacterium]